MQPQVKLRFDSMFENKIEYFKKKCTGLGIKHERVNSVAIKMASVLTDIHFAKLHEQFEKSK